MRKKINSDVLHGIVMISLIFLIALSIRNVYNDVIKVYAVNIEEDIKINIDYITIDIRQASKIALKELRKVEDRVRIEKTNREAEIHYLARCVEAEAGNQGLLGKRYVVDVILNRVDDERFPDTIRGVIDEKNQFEVTSNGMIESVYPTEETMRAIELEMNERTDCEILYFRTEHYHSFGTPCFQYNDHYFSK